MVVTLNCPRAAYLANIGRMNGWKELADPIQNLKELMDSAVEIFEVKKNWMDRLIKAGRIPFATQTPVDPNNPSKKAPVAIDLDSCVYTIGVVGIDDTVAALTGKRMHESKQCLELGLRIVAELKAYAIELSEKHGLKIALARTPAETTAQRFAVCDLTNENFRAQAQEVVHGDVKTALLDLTNRDLPVYYVNGTHVPPDAPVNVLDRLKLESKFFPILDGGNIAHVWLGEACSDPEGLYDFGMKVAKNTQV